MRTGNLPTAAKTFTILGSAGSIANATAVHASIAGTTGTQAITSAITNPVAASFIVAAQIDVAPTGPTTLSEAPFGRVVTVTTSASAASYTTGVPGTITIKGTDVNGSVISDTVAPTASGGGETLKTTKAFVSVTEIDLPLQPNTSGTFTIGVGDVVLSSPALAIRTAASGSLHIGFDDGSSDTIPVTGVPEIIACGATRIIADAGTTVIAGITCFR